MENIISISICEGDTMAFVICNDNKHIEGYSEVNTGLNTLIGFGSDDRAIIHMKKDGLLPKKEVIFKMWIKDEIYQGFLKHGGFEVVDSDVYSIS
jgi:hypothetical protein